MTSSATPTAAYTAALRALQRQQRARLTTLIQQTEAALHREWQAGPAFAAQLYRPVLDEYARALADLRLSQDDPAAKLGVSWLNAQNAQLRSIEASVQASMTNYAGQAARTVEEAQNAALARGLQDASNLTQEALFPASRLGVNPDVLFSRPNPDALALWAGRAGNGHPLGDLFANFPAEATSEARKAMLFGLATGANPKAMAAGISQAMGISRSRAIIINRSEVLTAYRAAAHETYRANSDVLAGWLWSAGGNNPCAMCMGMDGTFHGLWEDLSDHPCGKCSPLPVTKDWGEIFANHGFGDIDTSELGDTRITRTYVSGEEKFAKMSAERQRAILGTKTGYEAYKNGEVTLKDFIGVRPGENGFPAQYYQKSLRELQIPTERGLLVQPSSDITEKWLAGELRARDFGRITPDELMPAWAKQSDAARIVYQIMRNGLPDNMSGHQLGLLTTNLEQMLKQELPLNVRVAALKQLDVLQQYDRYLSLYVRNVTRGASTLGEPPPFVYRPSKELEQALAAARAGERARLEAQAATQAAADLDGFALREPVSREAQAADLEARRGAAVAQQDAARTRLAALSERWRSLVLDQAEFDPEDDLAEIAALEAKILKVEEQQAAQLAKIDTLDERIAALDKKLAEARMAPDERAILLRQQVDERIAQREMLYARQHDLLDEQRRLENLQRETERNGAFGAVARAEVQAKYDLYRQSLDQADPEVKRYLKDFAAYTQNKANQDALLAEQRRLEQVMDTLSVQGKKGSAEFAQARADYETAGATYQKTVKASDRLYDNLWQKSRGVYKPELDSIAGAEVNFQRMGLAFKAEDIANHPLVVAAREHYANLDGRIASIKEQVQALEKPIKAINKEIEQQISAMRDLHVTLRAGGEMVDTLRPFSDVIQLPEGRQPPNALMNKLDYRMKEPRAVTKRRIIDDIATRLKNNPAWQEYVRRSAMPDIGRLYHGYIPEYASARDSKSAQLVADFIKKWGVGYKPGSPEWVAMQTAVKEEFGLDADLHAVTAAQLREGAAFYQENGAALRAFMRAQYENTQQWFADHGIQEIEVYRGFGWSAAKEEMVPKGINWGPVANQNYGVTDMALNPFQSFSADINISQGTGGAAAGAGFAGGGFGGGADYSLLVGAKIPVERVLGTAQTGFGAKLESEIVVMGRATDTVAYRAGTKVESALLQQAEEQSVGERQMVYSASDGTKIAVEANRDGTFTVTLLDGVSLQTSWTTTNFGTPKLVGTNLKVGASKTYKTEKKINEVLRAARISNVYTAPPAELALQEGEAAALRAVTEDMLRARLDRIPADATVDGIQQWVRTQLSGLPSANLAGLDPAAARLVANASANLLEVLPEVNGNLWRIAAQNISSDALAFTPRDGLSLIINPEKWADLPGLAARTAHYFQQGWWTAQTPEQIIGHEIGHLVQLNYNIDNDAWIAAMDRVAATGADPLVSAYAGAKVEEAFAETFGLLVYGEPTETQWPIVRELAQLLREHGIDYNRLRAAVGARPLDLVNHP